MTVAGKLTTAFGLLLVLMGATIAYQMSATRRTVSNGFALARIFERLEQSAAGQADELDRMEEAASKLQEVPDLDYEAVLQDAVHAFGATLRRADAPTLAAGERREMARLRGLWAPVPAQADSLAAAVGAGTPDARARLNTLLQSVSELRAQSR